MNRIDWIANESISKQLLEVLADAAHVSGNDASLILDVVELSIEAFLEIESLRLDHVLDLLELCLIHARGAVGMGAVVQQAVSSDSVDAGSRDGFTHLLSGGAT